MNKISNNTEIAVIFERKDIEGMVTMFYPIKVVTGYADKKKKEFIATDGNSYKYMTDTNDKYSFGLRRTIGSINKTYRKKTLNKLLEAHLIGLSQFVYYFRSEEENINTIDLVCEDGEENVYILDDKDFNSFKKNIINKEIKNEKVEIEIKVDSKSLIEEIKKKIIGQDEAIEDIVSIIWQNSKSKRKQNILLTGPTGVGKTEIIRIIAKKLNIPMVIANATSLTQTGYVGKSIDDVLEDLIVKCDNDINKAEHAIIVIDEIDKLAGNNLTNNDVATTGVQDELLKLVEDGTYTINTSNDLTKKNNVIINTKDITFIAIGAFSELLKEKQEEINEKNTIGFSNIITTTKEKKVIHLTTDDLVKYGLKQELIGRFTNVIELNPLTKENLIQIMKNPNEELIKEKLELLNSLGIQVNIKENVYEKLASIALNKNTGARGLIGAVDNLFIKAITEISQNENTYEKLTIDENTIDNPKNYILQKRKSNK